MSISAMRTHKNISTIRRFINTEQGVYPLGYIAPGNGRATGSHAKERERERRKIRYNSMQYNKIEIKIEME